MDCDGASSFFGDSDRIVLGPYVASTKMLDKNIQKAHTFSPCDAAVQVAVLKYYYSCFILFGLCIDAHA